MARNGGLLEPVVPAPVVPVPVEPEIAWVWAPSAEIESAGTLWVWAASVFVVGCGRTIPEPEETCVVDGLIVWEWAEPAPVVPVPVNPV